MSISTAEKLFSCPASKICHLAFEGTPACGEDPNHITDPVPPHRLCTNALWNRFQAVSEGDLEPVLGRKLSMEAELLVNLGSHPDTKNSEATGYFDSAQDLIKQAKATTQTRQPFIVNAGLIHLFMNTYSDYSHGFHPSNEDRRIQREGISRLMYKTRIAPVDVAQLLGREHVNEPGHLPCLTDESERKSLYTKLALMQLVLKAGFDLLPTPSRTRRVCDALVWHDDQFTPISTLVTLRTNKQPPKPPEVLVIPFESLVWNANRRPHDTALLDGPQGEIAETAAYLLEKDTSIDKPEFIDEEKSLLNIMADSLRERIRSGRVDF